MKKLIVTALLSSMLIGCGNTTEEQQITTNQEYVDQADSSESYDSGLEFIYNVIGRPISDFNDSIDLNKFYTKRVSNAEPMLRPFGDSGVSISFNDKYYYFGVQSDKTSWEDPNNFTLDYIYMDTYDIREYLDLDIVVNTDGSNMDEVKESFAELWGDQLGTIELRWKDDYADMYKFNDIYILALHNGDDVDNNYTDLVFSNDRYIRYTAKEDQLSKIGLEAINIEPSYIDPSDLESITFQYMDMTFSVDTSKIKIDSGLLVTDDGTLVADKHTICRAVSDTGNRLKFELSYIDDYNMELLSYRCTEYDNYKYYTSASEYDAYIEADNLVVRVSNDLTKEERDEIVNILDTEFIAQ